MFENKVFKIEVEEKSTDVEKVTTTQPVKDDVKELVIYTVKAVATLIIISGIVHTIGTLLINWLS